MASADKIESKCVCAVLPWTCNAQFKNNSYNLVICNHNHRGTVHCSTRSIPKHHIRPSQSINIFCEIIREICFQWTVITSQLAHCFSAGNPARTVDTSAGLLRSSSVTPLRDCKNFAHQKLSQNEKVLVFEPLGEEKLMTGCLSSEKCRAWLGSPKPIKTL